jgi:hypothetical protein
LEKLRNRLARSGHATTVTSLSAALASNATEAAPAQLATSISSGIASPAGAPLHLLAIANGAIRMMFWTQFKVVATIVASIVILAAGAATTIVVTRQVAGSPNHAQAPDDAGAIRSQPLAVTQPAPATQPQIDPPWRAEFDAVYTLDETEAVRRIRPPFIAARKGFLHDKYSVRDATNINGVIGSADAGYTTQPPGALFLDFDNRTHRVERWLRSSQRPWTLGSLVVNLIGLTQEQYVLPAEIHDIRIDGDWVIRHGAATDAKLQAFQDAVRGTPAAFEVDKQILQRQVVVAHGIYTKEDWPGGVTSVSLTEVKEDRASAGDVKFFFGQLTKMFGRPVINEWKGSEEARIEFPDNFKLPLPGLDKPGGDQKLNDVLTELGRQMHVEMTTQTRAIDTWVFSPANERPRRPGS